MKKILIFCFLLSMLFLSRFADSQCACCSSIGCGDNSGGSSSLVKKGKILFNITSRYSSFKPLSNSQLVQDANNDTSFSVYNKSYQLTYTFSLTYGISNRFNVSVTLPYNSISNLETASPGENSVNNLGTSRGISNVKTSLQFVLLQRKCCNGWELVPTLGIIAPTGVHNNIARDGSIFDDQFQPGADSRVPVAGVAFDKMFSKLTIRGVYTYVFQYTDKMGNVDAALWNADLSGYIPLLKSGGCKKMAGDTENSNTMNCSPAKFVLNFFSGIQLEHIGRDIVAYDNGAKVYNSNTGALRTYISSGFVANIKQQLFIPISIAAPVYQLNNGYQAELKWRLNAGVSYLF